MIIFLISDMVQEYMKSNLPYAKSTKARFRSASSFSIASLQYQENKIIIQ